MSNAFSNLELERYARHLVLPEIGGAGQQKLKAARVIVTGAGGLGAPALQYLAAAGVGHLTLVDDDEVSLSNLQRQVIFNCNDVGVAKVDAAAGFARKLNPHVEVHSKIVRLDKSNARDLVEGHDVALDGSDNLQTRYILADICEELRVPLVSAAVNRFDGAITTFKPWETSRTATGGSQRPNPRYRDLFPKTQSEIELPTCAEVGVVGAVTGILGTLQALEVIKLITGAGDPLIGRLLMFEGLSMNFQTIRYGRSAE